MLKKLIAKLNDAMLISEVIEGKSVSVLGYSISIEDGWYVVQDGMVTVYDSKQAQQVVNFFLKKIQ